MRHGFSVHVLSSLSEPLAPVIDAYDLRGDAHSPEYLVFVPMHNFSLKNLCLLPFESWENVRRVGLKRTLLARKLVDDDL